MRGPPCDDRFGAMTVASFLTSSKKRRALLGLLAPEPLANGHEPETRFVYCGLSWEHYLEFDQTLGDDRPGPRFFYLEGELEIMTTSDEHERVKKWLAGFLEDYFLEAGLDVTTRGQATMRLALQQAGAEPDESWCVGAAKKFPDLVLEIALTSGGVRKLDLYRRFAVPEVWVWRKGRLEVFALRDDGSAYDALRRGSRLLPGLDIALLERCMEIHPWREARLAFRAGLAGGG